MKRSGMLSRQGLLHWSELVLLVALFLGVLVLINYITFRHNKRIDLTPEKRYTLSAHTLQTLDRLEDDLMATIFFKPKERRELEDQIRLFERASEKFSYRFVDLEKNPATAQAMNIKSYGAGIVEYRGKKERIQFFTEENVVRAIIRLTEEGEKTIRFVTGHGEKDISSVDPKNGYNRAKHTLELENYQVKDILLMQAERVPADTMLLVVSGPQKDLFQKELELIDQFLQEGGRVLMLCDPFPLERVEAWLKKHGVNLAHDFILDTKSKLIALDELTPIIMPNKSHLIAKHMNQSVVFPVSRSVTAETTSAHDVLAHSGSESWAELDTKTVYDGTAVYNPERDTRGPVPVAVAVRVETKTEPGLMVVMGDSDFAANHYFDILGNKDLFLNTVNWLAKKQRLISTRTQAAQSPVSMLFLTENENRLVLWSAVIIEPALIILLGIAVIFWRRMRR
ncbi:MAG: GldG family protein [Deltaproteobacteria bacterium]|nr:GldG family protein [Deltaproteobacteria bacterium]